MSKARQIIYAWDYCEWGGAQIYFMSLMKEAKKSYKVTAVLPGNSQPRLLYYLAALEVPTSFLPSVDPLPEPNGIIERVGQKLTRWRRESKLAQQLLGRPDIGDTIVHIDLGFWQSFLSLYRLCRKTEVFITVHTGLPQYTGLRGLRWTIKGKLISRRPTFHLLASNQDAKESLRRYISEEKYSQIEVVYSGFDPHEISCVPEGVASRQQTRDKWGLTDDTPVIVTVGQFIERKGCWILLNALRQLKSTGREYTFLWLSTSMPDASALQKIESFELSDRFRIMSADEIGNSRGDLLVLLSCADMFVLASLQEGLPIALVEAMALGLPCIATEINAVPEAIENGKTGILIPASDPARLADAISNLIADPDARERLGVAAKLAAYAKFNAREIASRMLELYDDVWKSNNQKGRISH